MKVPQPLDEALAAYERGDYDAAFREFLLLAKADNTEAQYKLGKMYKDGIRLAGRHRLIHDRARPASAFSFIANRHQSLRNLFAHLGVPWCAEMNVILGFTAQSGYQQGMGVRTYEFSLCFADRHKIAPTVLPKTELNDDRQQAWIAG